MVSHGKWIAGLALGVLGGCFASYGYNDFDGKGTGGEGTGGGGGQPGSSTNASSSSTGAGGNCAVTVCPPTSADNSMCNANGPCVGIPWAKRFGTQPQGQVARSVAIEASTANIIVGGLYLTEPVDFGGLTPTAVNGENGFVARLDSNGSVLGLSYIPNSDVRAVAVDGSKRIIAASVDSAAGMGLSVRQWYYADGLSSNIPIMAGIGSATPIAVTTDSKDDIYLLGETKNAGGVVPCNGESTTLSMGIFVVKYKGTDSTCQWVREFQPSGVFHAAAITAKNGVWITGFFGNTLGTTNAGSLTDDNLGEPSMFLINLNADTGFPDSMRKYVGTTKSDSVMPSAIDVAGDNIYVAGGVIGPTDLDSSLKTSKTGAFISMIPIVASGTPTHLVIPEADSSPTHGVRATGVVALNDRLYVSGTYTGQIVIGPAKQPLDAPNSAGSALGQNTPFLAVLDATSFQLRSFERFEGYGDPFDWNRVDNTLERVVLAGGQGSMPSVVLAGRWTHTLDFARGDTKSLNFLTEFSGTNPDIFVAKFTP